MFLHRRLVVTSILVSSLLLSGHKSYASEGEEEPAGEHHEKFDAGKFIIDHVTDKHEWHLWGSHEHPVSIPLPIIIYAPGKGLEMFMSGKFEHGHTSYKGYRLDDKGSIVAEDGSTFYDISITRNVASMLISVALLLWIFLSVAGAYGRRKGMAPKGLQSFMEPLIVFIRDDVAKAAIGPKYERYLPFLLTVFFFIFMNNMLGLIPIFPGGSNVTGNIAITMTLAVMTFVITTVSGNKHYWTHILWMPGVPALVKILLLTPIEVMSIFLKPFVLMIRLFANIVAGHIVILSFVCLIFVFGSSSALGGWGFAPVSLAFAIFMNLMELLVAFLQAYVFTLLSAMYFGAAVEEAHPTGEHH